MPEVSRTPFWVLQESIAHRLSEGEPLRIYTTILRGTAPNDIHIFIRLISSDSGIFSRHGTLIPILDKVAANDRRLHTQSAATHPVSIWTKSGFSELTYSSLLSNFSSGTSRFLVENSRLPAPATWVTNSPWDEPTSSTTTTLSFVLSDKIFFLYKLKHVAIRLSSHYIVYLHTLSCTPILSNFDGFVCQQKHQHDISRIRWGTELKISSFQIFIALSCSTTNILYITFSVT